MENNVVKSYKERLIDETIDKYLNVFGGIVIEGPKWCGKTWTSLKHAKSVSYLTDKNVRTLALNDPKLIFNDERPQLIDEWQLAPCVWDAVRLECDLSGVSGNFILTGSTTLQKEDEDEVYHSGTGRFLLLKMYPMSLYESGDSNGSVSLMDMFDKKNISAKTDAIDLRYLAYLVIRGGWPANVRVTRELAGKIPESYIDILLKKDIHERKDKRRSSEKMEIILKSLARNESTVASMNTLLNDTSEFKTEDERVDSRGTLEDYLKALEDLYLINNQPAFSTNYRSSSRIGKSVKRHLVDPSLTCAVLNLNVEKLLYDLNTFGLIFESLVYRDLCIYMNYLGGKVYHFRDNTSGDEIDEIVELSDGRYGAIEVKISYNEKAINEAKEGLLRFKETVSKKPEFLCIIVGVGGGAYVDSETGIYIVPINSLKP
ncbi:uncharacterized protein BN733_00098 [Clostridium sp. CAG:609]|nr:uncharacterized protein BN733_00098 [Clostridium sp. CAG:609]